MAKKVIENKELREDCYKLFDSVNILNSDVLSLMAEYKRVYALKPVALLINDEELIRTATLFFENDLNISLASKRGFMHRNTLIYRLDKIEKQMGLDIRNFKDAVVFSNMLLLYNKIKKDLY